MNYRTLYVRKWVKICLIIELFCAHTYQILLFTYGVSYGSITINLWNYIFDYIIPYVNLLDPSWDLFGSIKGFVFVPYGVSYGSFKYQIMGL